MGNMQNRSGFSCRIGSFASLAETVVPTMAAIKGSLQADKGSVQLAFKLPRKVLFNQTCNGDVQTPKWLKKKVKRPLAKIDIFETRPTNAITPSSCHAQIRICRLQHELRTLLACRQRHAKHVHRRSQS